MHLKQTIPLSKPSIGEAEKASVMRALDAGQLSQDGMVFRFETEFAAAHGTKFGVSCNSGTTALQLALLAAGVQAGDHVLVPSLCMVAVANAVLYCGAKPIFADAYEADGNICLNFLNDNSIQAPKAAIVAHLYGAPAHRVIKYIRICWPETVIIQDCAEAHYAADDAGMPLPTLGDLSTFSFYGNKIISAGEGGMILTDSEYARDKMCKLRSHAFGSGSRYMHTCLAFSYRMTELQAAVALPQHHRRWELAIARKLVAHWYTERLRRIEWLELPMRGLNCAWWVYPLLIAKDGGISRDEVRAILLEAGVHTRNYFEPLNDHDYLAREVPPQYRFDTPVARDLSQRGFYLPLYPDLTEQQVNFICSIIACIHP